MEIVSKASVTCTHATTIKKAIFYVTNLVTNEHCVCKEVAVEALNAKFPRGLDLGSTMQNVRLPPPIDVKTKLRPDCKQHILELFQNYLMVLVL